MPGSSKVYGGNRPQDSGWRSADSRMMDASRPFRDSRLQETSRQREDLRLQNPRLSVGSGMQQNYSPSRMYNASDVQGSVRGPGRAHEDSQLMREVRAHQDSRMMETAPRLQENPRMFDPPLQDHLNQNSDVVAYDYHHRPSDDVGTYQDSGMQSKFINSHENFRSGRSYPLEDSEGAKQGFLDILSNNSLKKQLDMLSGKNYHGPAVSPGHIMTPSLTSGPQPRDGMRPIGNKDFYQKEKSSKAFDYLKAWRLKMNMPTDSFLLEKEDLSGNQQQETVPMHVHDDWYTQPIAEPRRVSTDQEWNSPETTFVEKETYGDRPGPKYGNVRYGSYGDSAAGPKSQGLESDRIGNPPWKWEEFPGDQNPGAKRNYENMTVDESFNPVHRDVRFIHDTVPPKRPRLSPSVMQNERGGAMEQYSHISEQENLPQSMMNSDDGRYRISVSCTYNEPQSGWAPPFQSKPVTDSNKFSGSFGSESEDVSSRHMLPYGEMKGTVARGRSQTSYTHSRNVKNIPHLSTERSPEPLGRHKYIEPQDHAGFPGQRIPRELNQGPMDHERPLPSEVFMSDAPYSVDTSPRSYHGVRLQRSPVGVKSPGMYAQGKSPVMLPQGKSQAAAPRGKYSDSNTRDGSPPWRKGRSPGPGRDRTHRPERGRSPGPAPGFSGRQRSNVPMGRQRSPGTQELPGAPKRERSLELTGRVKSSGPGRGRSPGHPIRQRSPESARRERMAASPGRGRLLDGGRWRSPGRSPGREKSPFRRGKPLGSSDRGKSPILPNKGRPQGVSGGGRSPGPPGGQPSGPLVRGRSAGKSHAGRRGSPVASEKRKLSTGMSSKPSGREKPLGPDRNRPSVSYGSGRSPGAGGNDRSPRLTGKGRMTDAPGRSPRLLATGKPSKIVKGGSAELQQQPRPVSPATGVSVERKTGKVEQARSSSHHHSRGRSPVKGRSPVGTRVRSESSDRKRRPVMERLSRNGNRSPGSPRKRLSPEHREQAFPNEYRDFRVEDRSPYLEEVSLSPRSNRFWSPPGTAVINPRSRHNRERSLSVDALQRGCSPVSLQSEGNSHRRIYPDEPFFPEREGRLPQEHSPHGYRGSSPHSMDGYTSARQNSLEVDGGRGGRPQERHYSFSRDTSFSRDRQSAEKIHNTRGIWREHNDDRDVKKGSYGKSSNTRDVKAVSSAEYTERPEGPTEEEVDDEDLRIHLLRLREQKVEMKLMKLEEESKETEMKLLELCKNQTSGREQSPLKGERRFTEKDHFRPHGERHEPFPRKRQHSASQHDRFRRQHKRF